MTLISHNAVWTTAKFPIMAVISLPEANQSVPWKIRPPHWHHHTTLVEVGGASQVGFLLREKATWHLCPWKLPTPAIMYHTINYINQQIKFVCCLYIGEVSLHLKDGRSLQPVTWSG